MSLVKIKNKRRSHVAGNTGGFTIVELVVAAVIMVITLFAIVAVIRKSSEIQVNDHHRRQARMVIMRTFETVFAPSTFPGPYPLSFIDENYLGQDGDGLLKIPGAQPDPLGPFVVDTRDGFDDNDDVKALTGNMYITIGNGVSDGMPYHEVEIKLCWDAPDGPDSLILMKRLMNVR